MESSGGSVVSAYSNQQLDIVVLEELQVKPFLKILIRRFVTAHHQMRTAPVEYVVSQEEIHVDIGRFSVEKALISLMQTDNPVSFGYESLRYSAYNGAGPPPAKITIDGFISHCANSLQI